MKTLVLLALVGLFYLFPTLYGVLGRVYTPQLLMTGRSDAVVVLLPEAVATVLTSDDLRAAWLVELTDLRDHEWDPLRHNPGPLLHHLLVRPFAPARRRLAMPKMVVTHAVVEVERWLQGKAERAEVIGRYATNVTDYVAADGSSNVAITADIHDMAGLQALMTSPSPEDTAAQERHGVIQPIIAYVEK